MTTFKVTLRSGANFITEVQDFDFMIKNQEYKDNDLFAVGKIITSKSQIESITLLSQETMAVDSDSSREGKGITVSDNGDLHMKGNLTTVSEEDSCVTIKNGESSILINEDGTIEIKGKEIKFSNNNHYNNVDAMINGLSERGIKFN